MKICRKSMINHLSSQLPNNIRITLCHYSELTLRFPIFNFSSVQKVFVVNPHIKNTYNGQTFGSMLQTKLSSVSV